MQSKLEIFNPEELDELRKENQILNSLISELQHELEAMSRLSIQAKKNEVPVAAKKSKASGSYGYTADQIKKQAAYKLGQLLITNSKSISGIIKTPYMIYSQIKSMNTTQEEYQTRHLTDEESKRAEKVKLHLSYRLGEIIIKNKSKPLSWFSVPFKILNEVRSFRNDGT